MVFLFQVEVFHLFLSIYVLSIYTYSLKNSDTKMSIIVVILRIKG